MANEGIWFKLQPFFTGLLMGGYLLYRILKKESLMVEMMKSMHSQSMPDEIIIFIERNMSVFLISYGFFMGFIALNFPTETWLFFKTGGFYIVTIIFFIIQMVFIRKRIKGLQ